MSATSSANNLDPSATSIDATLGPPEEASLGELMSRMAENFSTLARKEVELAKVEIQEEAKKAGKGAGLMGGSGLAALFCLLMLSFAAAWGLAEVIPTGFAFFVVAILYLIVAAVLYPRGRRELRRVRPVPQQTVETLKEDVEWAKHPMP